MSGDPELEHQTPLDQLQRTVTAAQRSGDRTLVGRVLGAYAMAQSAATLWNSGRKWLHGHRTYTVSVRSDDPIYPDVHDWLLGTLTADGRRALVARSGYAIERSHDLDGSTSGDVPFAGRPRLHLAYNDSRQRRLDVAGHRVLVSVTRQDDDRSSRAGRSMVRPDEILFACQSEAGQRAVVAHLEQLVESHKPDRRPMLWVLNSWGSWSRRADLPHRELSTVVLAPGQTDRLLTDLQRFLAAEQDYVRLGVPWHRGYLLWGPPGTGKTSTVRALATALGLDLWYAPLGDVEKDAGLLNLIAEVRPRSMLLLEDIDAFGAAMDREPGREPESRHVTASGLLNALDGVATPHGLITVMTTNYPERLDQAVVRAGRVDTVEEFRLPDDEQVQRLFQAVYGQPPTRPLRAAGRSSADVVGVFKQHLQDPGAAEAALAGVPAGVA